MEGTYPIIIDGETVGELTVCAQGQRTCFDAVCRRIPGIVRLSVYGEGREGYLGVLAPEGNELSLHKTYSRAALRDFPSCIDTVEPAGLPRTVELPTPETATGPAPEAAAASEPERCWYASPDGALVCFDGTRSLLALPLGDGRIPANAAGERCTVEGREYQVFPTENGRVQW